MNIWTPCIGRCSTTYGDDVCRGCKRYWYEVVNWNRMTKEQKLIIKERLKVQKETVDSVFADSKASKKQKDEYLYNIAKESFKSIHRK